MNIDVKPSTKILFVCLGNICRSPAAEGIMKQMAEKAGLSEQLYIDSAGTYGGHAGELPDARMRHAAAKRTYILESRSRQLRMDDFIDFDHIIVMDDNNYYDVCEKAPDVEACTKVERISSYCKRNQIDHVPDPYYEGAQGFEFVLDILEDACENLLLSVSQKEH